MKDGRNQNGKSQQPVMSSSLWPSHPASQPIGNKALLISRTVSHQFSLQMKTLALSSDLWGKKSCAAFWPWPTARCLPEPDLTPSCRCPLEQGCSSDTHEVHHWKGQSCSSVLYMQLLSSQTLQNITAWTLYDTICRNYFP